jgi:phosphatase NudJ
MKQKKFSSPAAHEDNQFKPNTTVAAVIVDGDKFLMVEEIEQGKHVFNQPAGHLEANESLITAAQREISEETGLALTPQYCCGIYYYYSGFNHLYFLRFCFVIEISQQAKQQLSQLYGQDNKLCIRCSAQDTDIIATHWLTYDEIKSRENQLRSPMVLECIDDYLAKKNIHLSAFKSNI